MSFRERFKKLFHFFNPTTLAWRGATLGVSSLLLILWSLTSYHVIPNQHHWKSILIFFFVGILYILLICGIIFVVIQLVRRLPLTYLLAFGCFWIFLSLYVLPLDSWSAMLLIYLPMIFFASILGSSLYQLFFHFNEKSRNERVLLYFYLALSTAGLIGFGTWLAAQTKTFTPPPNMQEWKVDPQLQIPLNDPSEIGPYHIKMLSYGSGNGRHRPEYAKDASILSKTVDGSSFLSGWEGIEGLLRTWYWGFGPSELPLNATVWMPEGDGPFPLILIVHGNHEMMAFSEKGYAYLGNLFASQGMIAVAVDENFFNNSWFEWNGVDATAARGWLLLEHLKLWRRWNEEPSHPFYQKVDMQNIGLMGHSRGGEAIAIAAALNPLKHYPNDALIPFDYGFNIVALAAVAPVVGQFKPAGLPVQLENVNYFLMHGSHDGDILSFQGLEQYQRVSFAGKKFDFKSALYIFGANHGQFNNNWGLYDATFPSTTLYEVGQIMPKEAQQQIAKVYLSAFFKATLKGEQGYLPLFWDYRSGAAWLPKTVYVNQYDDSTFRTILGNTKDLDISKTLLPGGKAEGENLTVWRKGTVPLKQPGRSLDTGIYIGWNNCDKKEIATYTVTLPKGSLGLTSQDILVLSIADGEDDKEDSSCTPPDEKIDFTIELTDWAGNTAALSLSEFAYLPTPINVELMKSPVLDTIEGAEIVYKTFEYPLSNFVAQHPKFDAKNLKQIRLIFDRTKEGLIILDKIAVRSPLPLHQRGK